MISLVEIAESFYNIRHISAKSGIAALQYFVGEGIAFQTVIEPDPPISARIEIEGRHFNVITPDEQGVRAILFLARDEFNNPLDIVGWRPRTGDLLTWLGAASLLGENDIYNARLVYDGALPVWRSPLDWLRAGRIGVVIINPERAASLLADVGPLLAEDAAHGLELRQALTRAAPRILIPSFNALVAA